MNKTDKKKIEEKAIGELNEVINTLKDKREDEAWRECILLAVKHIGLRKTRDILSDKKLNILYLNKIEEIIKLINDGNNTKAVKKTTEILRKATSEQNIHSAIIPLIFMMDDFLKKQHDYSLNKIKGDFIEVKRIIQN